MKIKIPLIFILLLISLSSLIFSQEKKILIIAAADTIPKYSRVYITGNGDDLGNWNEMRPMDKISETRWGFELSAEKGDTLHFKFNRGNWRSEAVDSKGIEFRDFTYIVNNDTVIVYSIPNWRDMVQKKIIITPERLSNKSGFLELFEGWKYKIGDDSSWADPSYDDSNWESIKNPWLSKEEFNKMKWKPSWTGNIWYRNHITVDSALWNKTFGFSFFNIGAAEVYLDGKLLYKFGTVGHSRETEIPYFDRKPRHVLFDKKEEHLLAVRYSNFSTAEFKDYNIPVGFNALLGDVDNLVSNRIDEVRELSIQQMAFSAFLLAFAIMHLLLFIFYPKSKENLFYSISMLSFAFVVFAGHQNNFTNFIRSAINISIINSIAAQLAILFGLLTVYISCNSKLPKQYIVFVTISVLFIVQTIFFTRLGGDYVDYAFYFYGIICILEIFRVVVKTLRRKDPWGWGWLVGVGFIVAFLFITYQLLIEFEVVRPLFGIQLVYVYGLVFLAITVSINLSRKISDTNRDLEKQLIQVKELSEKTIEQERRVKDEEFARKLLEADNLRKTKELEEARKLQYSMLPKKIPPVPNLDIAVFMKTATEVGGDYYDFKYNNNGNPDKAGAGLTIAVGDATGHGMKAGTLVATIKGLFTAEPAQTDILSFFNKCNSMIRDMQLGNLYMAMMIAKIEGDKMIVSSAGMPPALIYRRKTKQIEEVRIPGLPLGGSSDSRYIKKETSLLPGDTLLLMSDGFPELFNKEREILDYSKAKEIFCSVAESPSKKIVEELNYAAENWMDGANQQDDITFVVVKVK